MHNSNLTSTFAMDLEPDTTNDVEQSLCLTYLNKLKRFAIKHDLGEWIENIIQQNKNKECSATTEEVELLAKMCDDLTVHRTSIPKILGKSYRYCFDNDIFKRIRKYKKCGQYSKLDTLKLKQNGKF